ncbi:GntR family transcriptional regulator [Rothia aerolata]|uniref:GntR family transcriptional regulator n=1 Tax=Rothia aerolata TaxID=1812262 RepID=A0A917IQN4_9MICC|nr:GntR family transcriptional regulator [Rothia aerolata]GGH59647.1 GntR family transcriptional regulator [Rothia aerolata]
MRASDKAYETLKADIMAAHLTPGSVLAEVEQAQRLGVSRTPVREAISRLVSEGLVEPNPGRGAMVSPVSLENVYRLFELRVSLDCTAAQLAAQRGDPLVFEALAQRFQAAVKELEAEKQNLQLYYALVQELDQRIDEAADNRYLLQAQQNIRSQLTRIRTLSKTNPARLIQAAREHQQICQAIASGEPEIAVAATKVHLYNALVAIEAAQSQHHELFTTTSER